MVFILRILNSYPCCCGYLKSILKYLNNLLRPQEIKREMINDIFSSLQKEKLCVCKNLNVRRTEHFKMMKYNAQNFSAEAQQPRQHFKCNSLTRSAK